MTLSACYVVHAKNQYFRNICTFSDAVKLCKKHLERSKAKTYDIVEKNRLIKHSSIFFLCLEGRIHRSVTTFTACFTTYTLRIHLQFFIEKDGSNCANTMIVYHRFSQA